MSCACHETFVFVEYKSPNDDVRSGQESWFRRHPRGWVSQDQLVVARWREALKHPGLRMANITAKRPEDQTTEGLGPVPRIASSRSVRRPLKKLYTCPRPRLRTL